MLPQVTFRGLSPSQSIVDAVWRKARQLNALAPEVAECHVVIEAVAQGRKRFWYSVVVHTTASMVTEPPAPHQVVSDDNVYIALRDAFDAAYEKLRAQAA